MNCPYGGLYNGIVEDSDNTVNMVRHDNKYVGSDMLNTRGEFLPIGSNYLPTFVLNHLTSQDSPE